MYSHSVYEIADDGAHCVTWSAVVYLGVDGVRGASEWQAYISTQQVSVRGVVCMILC